MEASKLYAELDKKMNIFEGYADHLSRRAGSQFQPGEDGELNSCTMILVLKSACRTCA